MWSAHTKKLFKLVDVVLVDFVAIDGDDFSIKLLPISVKFTFIQYIKLFLLSYLVLLAAGYFLDDALIL